ncbi:MAG: 16S rRNA (cytidine(1402)-2'-O)-methyltransferase [Oscillospiraceae bacterium]|nr:16S rRNA (cytidine(1402)-2'-O)-methyltransferase [Oscillospiraceae bacterium]
MSGILYVVGTPIGNLGDITERQLEILGSADFIAAEDTRVTRKLLSHFDLHTPLVSYHEHSPEAVLQRIAERLHEGESCAVVTDAGMPCISDPGALLVQRCIAEGIPVQVVPGPSAVVSALAVSGQETGRFCFEGFLSVNKKQRFAHLNSLRAETRTMIFYEAPHKLLRTLQDMAEAFGADRSLTLCRELTKIHEEVRKTTFGDAIAFYESNAPRGEFVLVIAGAAEREEKNDSLEAVVELAKERIAAGERAADVCRQLASETGYAKRVLYEAVVQNN